MEVSLIEFISKYPSKLPIDNPVFIKLNDSIELSELKEFLIENDLSLYSPIDAQINEYSEIFNLFYNRDLSEYKSYLNEKIDVNQVRGEFVFFNWGEKAIFNILPHSMHYELISWRNKDKINVEEQMIIAEKNIAVIGSSVGSFVSKTLSKSGFQNFKIAELKNIKPSNSPRLYTDSIRHYGSHKLIPLVQSIYEFNPYAKIETFNNGVSDINFDDFFNNIDVVIDAADDATTKINIHNYCEKFSKPLVYGFDEMGSMIIHRYDYPELNNYSPPRFNITELEELKTKNFEQYILKLLEYIPGVKGIEDLSERQQETIKGILSRSRGGFSQLAWEAALFGSCLSKATIDIVLGKKVSGYKFINLDVIITTELDTAKSL